MPRTRASTPPARPLVPIDSFGGRVQLDAKRWKESVALDLNDALDKLFPVDAEANASPIEAIRLAAQEEARVNRVEAVREAVRAIHRGLIDGGRLLPHEETNRGCDALGWLMSAAGYRFPDDLDRARQTLHELRLYAALTRPRRILTTTDLDRLLPRTHVDEPRAIAPLLQIEVLTCCVRQRDLAGSSQALRILQLALDEWLFQHNVLRAPYPAS